jgi:hypothetical protein
MPAGAISIRMFAVVSNISAMNAKNNFSSCNVNLESADSQLRWQRMPQTVGPQSKTKRMFFLTRAKAGHPNKRDKKYLYLYI